MRRFLDEMLELAERSNELKVHFATAREAFNMAMAAVDAQPGEPGHYRDYKLRQIMDAKSQSSERESVFSGPRLSGSDGPKYDTLNMNSLEYHLKELEIAVAANDPRTINAEIPEHVASVLDLGCGIGQGLLASRLKPEVFACGVDIDEAAVRYAKRLAPLHHFVCAAAERLPLRDRFFDCVVSRVTLPFVHIPAALR